MAAFKSNFFFRINSALLTGIRNAHDPIMIGKAVVSTIPRKLTRIRHGA
jgi:hypothetical protein